MLFKIGPYQNIPKKSVSPRILDDFGAAEGGWPSADPARTWTRAATATRRSGPCGGAGVGNVEKHGKTAKSNWKSVLEFLEFLDVI